MKAAGEPIPRAAAVANRLNTSFIVPPPKSSAGRWTQCRPYAEQSLYQGGHRYGRRTCEARSGPARVKALSKEDFMRHALRPLASVLLTLAVTVPAWAGAPTDQVKQYTDQVQKIVADPALRLADKRAAVRKVAGEVFDVNETARRALGPHWQARTPAEREEFVNLFADLLERTYISKIDLYGGLRYTSEIIDGEFATVRAKFITTKGSEIPVEARMLKRGGHWMIYDIAIENVSLIGNYRTQFDRIIRTASYGELVRRLKENREQFLNEDPTRSGRAS